MRNYGTRVAAVSILALGTAGAAWADSTPAKPAAPSLLDVLNASGLTASGYVDGTFSYFTSSGTGAPKDYSTFLLQQAGLTVAYQPSSGFGGLVDVVASPFSPYVYNYAPQSASASTSLYVSQAYAQYASGALTLIAGKFPTIAGAEVFAPSGNTNVTRSLLFAYEPLTLTGLRATYAPSDKVSLVLGVDNGWFNAGDAFSASGDKTLEAGVTWTPSKAVSWVVDGYFGRDIGLSGATGELSFLDTVLSWNVTSALTLVGSVDWGSQDNALGYGTGSASWVGYAAYVNYAINSAWRVSLRGEYFDDQDGYLTYATGSSTPVLGLLTATSGAATLKEGTVTLGYAPTSNVELRLEGRYDTANDTDVKTTQGWLEALYKF